MRVNVFLISMVIGVLGIYSGIIFQIKDYPGALINFLLGGVCIFISIFSIPGLKILKGNIISSKLTFFYKFVVPILMIVPYIGFLLSFLFFSHDTVLLYSLGSFLLFFISVIVYPLIYIKRVALKDTDIEVSNYKTVFYVKYKQIKSVQNFIFFYNIVYYDGKRKKNVLFMPKLSERVEGSGKCPKSIVILRDKVASNR